MSNDLTSQDKGAMASEPVPPNDTSQGSGAREPTGDAATTAGSVETAGSVKTGFTDSNLASSSEPKESTACFLTKVRRIANSRIPLWLNFAGVIIMAVGIGLAVMGFELFAYMTWATGVLVEIVSAAKYISNCHILRTLNADHLQQLLAQNVSHAAKLVNDMPEGTERTKAQSAIALELIKDINQHLGRTLTDAPADSTP